MNLGLSVSPTMASLYETGSHSLLGQPIFVAQPEIHGALSVGQLLALTLGAALPLPATLEIERFTLDGVDKSSELSGLVWDTTDEDISTGGLLEFQVRATNSTGTTLSDLIVEILSVTPALSWIIANTTLNSFDILQSLPSGMAPLATDIGGKTLQIGV